QLLENRRVQVCQPLEVQARLAHLVLSQPGQQRFLLSPFGHNIENEFPPAYGKAGETRLPCSSALVGVAVGTVADNARPPHLWLLPGDSLEDGHQGLAVRALFLVGPSGYVVRDADTGRLGLVLSHRPSSDILAVRDARRHAWKTSF